MNKNKNNDEFKSRILDYKTLKKNLRAKFQTKEEEKEEDK